ncbi:MAG: hypothetical protein HUJ31_18000 [Pseudomonadales bacterium]|nr:hypothetical protein [Pseudomonadales bacterium]
MDVGSQTLCLRTSDLAASRSFYQALGGRLFIDTPEYCVFDIGTSTFALMPFLKENCLNFRGASMEAIRDHMNTQGFELSGEIQRYKSSPGGQGECLETSDPDMNILFFDTNESDTPHFRAKRLLQKIELELGALGLDSVHFAAFRNELEEFAGGRA